MAIAVGASAFLGFVINDRSGNIAYDEAVYLERGFYHAHQIELRPAWQWPARLVYSLSFEGPKPPLFHGWVGGWALLAGDLGLANFATLVALSSFGILMLAVFLGGAQCGTESSLAALVALLAFPGVLVLGSHVLVETLLTALVTGAAVLAERVWTRPSARAAVACGILVGLAALTKLTAVYLLAVPLILVVGGVARRSGPKSGARVGATIGAGALLVAGPWYGSWILEAFSFARFSAVHPAWADQGQAWTRPLRLFGSMIGPVALAAVAIFAIVAWREREQRRRETRPDTWIAAGVALPSAMIVSASNNFDPRFWAPALGVVAIWLGRRGAVIWREAGPLTRRLLVLVALGPLAYSASAVVGQPFPGSVESIRRSVAALPLDPSRTSRICNLGNTSEWNVFKLRLAVELAGLRPRAVVSDLLVLGARSDVPLEACDVVFLLNPGQIPSGHAETWSNRGLEELAGSAEILAMENCIQCEGPLKEVAGVRVLLAPAEKI